MYELRKRLFYIAVSVGLFGISAAGVQTQLTDLLLKPANGQQFIYTSPGGGFDFVFKLCLYTGIAMSIPVIVYQLVRYLDPLVKKQTMHFIGWLSIWSGIMAGAGIIFAYYVGLPAALNFLLHGFSSEQIKALINIQSYLSFVMIYLLGSALLFQIPLIMIFINKIKPLQPKKLMKLQKWVFLIAFILGAIISPSPDIRNQALLSGPIIIMYEFSVGLIWSINRRQRKPKKVVALLQKDAEIQAERLAKFQQAQQIWQQALQTQPAHNKPAAATTIRRAPLSVRPTGRPNNYLRDFSRQPQRRFVNPA
ncbi:MAG TPA: twin-arginine translocase subunit TatC [Candidatus Saccharimonadales bacterium]|nr:twin-arginine translocase subunit TatC [Candidatus Saccharimonadales bacterium]